MHDRYGRWHASVNLGASGPSPTVTNDADPDYRPRRVVGFVRGKVADAKWEFVPTDPDTVPALLVAEDWPPDEPLLWEGDQG